MSNAWSLAKRWKLLLCFLAVAVVGCVGLLALQPKPAEALYPPNTQPPAKFNPVTPERKAYFEKILQKTADPNTTTANTARQIVRDNFTTYAPRLAPKLMGKGGLAGTAVGVWTVVGLELYFLPCWECSQESIKVDSQISRAPGSLAGAYKLGTCSASGIQAGQCSQVDAVVTYAGAKRTNGVMTADVYGMRAVTYWQKTTGTGGVISWHAYTPSLAIDSSGCCIGAYSDGTDWSDLHFTQNGMPAGYTRASHIRQGPKTWNDSVVARFYNNMPGPNPTNVSLCGSYTGNCNSGGARPTIDFGIVTPATPSNSVKTTPEEGANIINGAVGDSRAPGILPGETQPYVPPMFDPYKDPLGDPDADSIPNQGDPDPEGDGDQDGDGEPNEHPNIKPWPIADDPENDGDPNHDGSSNETFPPVYYDPYSPQDNPNGDPDGDGVPNIIDEDPADPDVGGHPWEYLPYGAPEVEQQPWTEIKPPGNDDGDEEIFGPRRFTQAEEDESGIFVQQFGEEGRRTQRECWTDNTGDLWCQYWKEHGPQESTDYRLITVYFGTGQWPPFYIFNRKDELNDDWNLLGACQPNLGDRIVHRIDHYDDGTQRSTMFNESVDFEDTDTATPICKKWFDGNDNQISAPADESPYPMKDLRHHLPFVI